MSVLRQASNLLPESIDPIDPGEKVPVAFQWQPYLESWDATFITSSTWEVSSGLLQSDDSIDLTETVVYIEVDPAAELIGRTVEITNEVTIGLQRVRRTVRTTVREL